MAAASALHELTRLQWNPTFSYTLCNTQRSHHASSLFFSKPQRKSNFVRLQIVCKSKQSPCPVKTAQPDSDPAQIWKNSFDEAAIQIKETLNCALARSGVRFGGRAFSSSSQSSLAIRRLLSWIPIRSLLSWISITLSCFLVLAVVDSLLKWSWIPITLFCDLVLAAVRSLFSDILPKTVVWVLPIAFVWKLFHIIFHIIFKSDLTDYEETSVLKLQVGLLGSGRTILEDFNRLAESADTSTKNGLSYVLTEATLALLRHPGCCISCYKSVDVKRSPEDGEKRFNELSFEERAKFDEETLVNVNSRKRQSSKIPTASGFSSEYIVVTILVAAKGVHKLKPINGTVDLKEALKKLGLIPKNKIMAVELQWTPQNEKDTLSERELLEDYPLLKPL